MARGEVLILPLLSCERRCNYPFRNQDGSPCRAKIIVVGINRGQSESLTRTPCTCRRLGIGFDYQFVGDSLVEIEQFIVGDADTACVPELPFGVIAKRNSFFPQSAFDKKESDFAFAIFVHDEFPFVLCEASSPHRRIVSSNTDYVNIRLGTFNLEVHHSRLLKVSST